MFNFLVLIYTNKSFRKILHEYFPFWNRLLIATKLKKFNDRSSVSFSRSNVLTNSEAKQITINYFQNKPWNQNHTIKYFRIIFWKKHKAVLTRCTFANKSLNIISRFWGEFPKSFFYIVGISKLFHLHKVFSLSNKSWETLG